MKYVKFIVLLAFLVGCKKHEVKPSTLEGTWELRNVLGGQIANAPSTFKAGNGSTIVFSANEYQYVTGGKVYSKGTYVIVKESAEVDGTQYEDRIIFDNNDWKNYIKRSGNKLSISMGSIASDGYTNTYQKL